MDKIFVDSGIFVTHCMTGDTKAILIQLKTEERIDALESIIREHIATCEKAKA
ncbi:MAG: hypothetical protein O8C62_05040 [Candidatus Methanoperedens sp.]|nr:hypothetical protein [Candidatus Methanoperedens sp.]